MKKFFGICGILCCFLSFGQENKPLSISINWEELSEPLLLPDNSQHTTTQFKLTEVNLGIDLRQQSLRNQNNLMIVEDPTKKYVIKDFSITINPPLTKSSNFTISGRGNNTYKNPNSVKNQVYRDAALNSGSFFYNRLLYSTQNE